jgi:hypothetical protein
MKNEKVVPTHTGESPEIERAFELLMEERDPPSPSRAVSKADAAAHKVRQAERRVQLLAASKAPTVERKAVSVAQSPVSNTPAPTTEFSRAFDILIPGHEMGVIVETPEMEVAVESDVYSTTPG